MTTRFALRVVLSFLAAGLADLSAQAPSATPDINDPTGNTGALKAQIQTAGSYDAHSGNATRIVNDLHVPGALGGYGLDFTRYWNSLQMNYDDDAAAFPVSDAFGWSIFSHSWQWSASYEEIYPAEIPGSDQDDNKFTTAYNITFPDGHTTQFKIVRVGHGEWLVPAGYPQFGPPYTANEIEQFSYGGMGVHDHLCNMNNNGTDFYLCLADGGSVHFVNLVATEVFDPHGLRTELRYDSQGHLTDVIEEGGRFLKITWEYISGGGYVITRVQGGRGPNGAGINQTVTYHYANMGESGTSALVLHQVVYEDEPLPGGAPGQKVAATYWYGGCWDHVDQYPGQCPYPNGAAVPILQRADDPHFAGPMTTILYAYRGVRCPKLEGNPLSHLSYFRAQPFAVAAEKSATGVAVSTFEIDCDGGARRESNGLGGTRGFYFGASAGTIQGGFDCRGFQLGRVTDFVSGPPSLNAPAHKQNFSFGEPRQIWDGRDIMTEEIAGAADDSGLPAQINYADSSHSLFNRTNPGNSAPLDPAQGMHNSYNHWLFGQTDERNFTTTYTRDPRRRIADITYPVTAEHFTYNGFNQVLTHTLASGAVVTHEYDSRGLLQREYNSVDGYAARKEYTYDSLDRIFTISDGRSRSAGKDFSIRMTYNGRHQVLSVEYAGTVAGPNPTVTYGYDAYGNRTSVTDELGHTKFYTYDDYRRCTSLTEPLNAMDWKGTRDPDGQAILVPNRTWTWIYDRLIDGVGQRGELSHTSSEWRVQIEPAFNAAGDRRMTARAHDINNRLVMESTGWIQPAGAIGNWYFAPDGENHYFGYDANGQKNYFKDPQGRETTYDYDPLRNRLWKTNETVNSVPRTTSTLYDVTGNKTLTTFPDTRTQQWLDYDAFGQPGRVIDERGNTTHMDYVWGPMKKLYHVTTHRLKDNGTEWEDQPTTFSYDLMGKATDVEFPDHSHETTTYEFGQVKTWKTRKNQTKTIVYDARGREVSHAWDDPSGGCNPGTDTALTPCIARSWDAANRLASITNKWSSIDFAYDDAGQVIWEGNEIAGSGGRTQTNYYRYPNGSVAHLHYPGGTFIRNDYTSRGQLAATGWDDDENNWWRKLAAYTYLQDGKVDHVDYGNGMRSAIVYDPRGFAQTVDHSNPGLTLDYSRRQYWRDSRDRITAFQKNYNPSINPMENGRGDRFRYDDEGQLVEGWYNATNPASSGSGNTRYDGFSYDALGNRGLGNYVASRGQMDFTKKDNKLNQYSGWWPYCFIKYDDDIGNGWGAPGAANGVVMQDGWVTAGFNALNQPMYISSPTYYGTPNWMYFGYDPLGRCVKRWVGESGDIYSNPATYYHYDGSNLLQEGANAWGPARVYAHGNRVDEIVWSYNTFTGEQAYHHYDARGHCTLLTDSGGNILEQYEYDAFGWPYFYDANGNAIGAYDPVQNLWEGYSQFGNRFLFTGREWIADLKLYDYRNRMYQPELGRFMQPDPKHFAAGDYNLYRYCHNDPVNGTDPMGLQDEKPNLTLFGEGEWKKLGSAFTNGEMLTKANQFVAELERLKASFEKDMNIGSPNVHWSGGFSNTLEESQNFLDPRNVAKTDLSVASAAVTAGGKVSFNNHLTINIHWNIAQKQWFGRAFSLAGNMSNKTGEIMHARDAVFAGTHSFGAAASARDIGNKQAAMMVGQSITPEAASSQMERAFDPWIAAWRTQSKALWDGYSHVYGQ